MDKHTYRLPLLILWLAFVSPSHAQESWFEDAPSDCTGISRASEFFSGLGITNGRVKISVLNGRLYAQASKALLDEKAVQLSVMTLDGASSKRVRDYMLREASGFEVPYVIGPLQSLTFGVLPAGPSFVAGLGFSLFTNSMQQKGAQISALSTLVADGGTIERVLAPVARSPAQQYAVIFDRYYVKVGNEVRQFLLRSCVMPVETVIEAFETVNTPNAKRVVAQSGKQWSVFDITDQKVEATITYQYQDEEFFYFVTQEGTRIRISYKGGPYQHLRDGIWRTLYAATQAS